MQRPLHIDLLRDNEQKLLKISIGEQTKLLDAAHTEALIEQLALFRATMRTAVPDQMSSRYASPSGPRTMSTVPPAASATWTEPDPGVSRSKARSHPVE